MLSSLLQHNIDKEKRNLDLTIFTCFTEYKKKIDVNLKMNCEDDVDVLHSLVFDFFEFLRTVIQISVWLEVFICLIHYEHGTIHTCLSIIYYRYN